MRALLTALAYLASLLATAALSFALVMFLAGPHGGVLPSAFQPVALGIGWLAVLAIPVLVARQVWRRGTPPQG